MLNFPGDMNNGTFQFVDAGDIHVGGKISDHSLVVLVSTGGSIVIDGKIEGHSNVTLRAAGNVAIGPKGGDDGKIRDGSSLEVTAGGNISLGGEVKESTVTLNAHGGITAASINLSNVRQIADGDITVTAEIDGTSRVDLVSNHGSIRIGGKIDGESKVSLTAALDIGIGVGPKGGDDDRKIDGNSTVTAISGASITLQGGIYSNHTSVDFATAGTIAIGKDISGGANVRLLSVLGQIAVNGGIADGGTSVTSWPPKALTAKTDPKAALAESQWTAADTLSMTPARTGYWWENWPQNFGYVSQVRVVPRSLDDIANAIASAGSGVPMKAIGGGWSFTDASLPLQTQTDVDLASIRLRGASRREDMRHVLEGINDLFAMPMDLQPQAVGRNVSFSTVYEQKSTRQLTRSGVQLPSFRRTGVIDTRSLAANLRGYLDGSRVGPVAGVPQLPPEILFHVEAGITIADLQQLLDHELDDHHHRLAIQATGGSPGATLAGALSTATHGGEFKWPLLVDEVRAIHLVGPGGEQWWIEGDRPVADPKNLLKNHPEIKHFIGGGWNVLPGLNAQDVLNAVTVSMGTIGTIYSVVFRVVPQFGLRQVVHPTNWQALLVKANITEQDLRSGNAMANNALLNLLLDGSNNGTGIALADNVYANLAINPVNHDCWVVNRHVTPSLPDDNNNPAAGMGDYATALSRALSPAAVDKFQDSKFTGRLFDFLSWATDVADLPNDAAQAGRLLSFVTGLGDPLGGVAAAATVQTVANAINAGALPDRGQAFIGDLLSGFLHAMEGTAPGMNSDRTATSYKLGAIGWPDGGVPGRGLEIALDPTNAFTFLQTVLFDDILANIMTASNNPFLGYISIRICPPTRTLLGMQQYSKYSVMIEVVAYRSPHANNIMDAIQAKALAFAGHGPKPLLHWGLENDQLTKAHLAASPLGQPYKAGLTRLQAFTKIRDFLRNGHPAVFDNNFSHRMGF